MRCIHIPQSWRGPHDRPVAVHAAPKRHGLLRRPCLLALTGNRQLQGSFFSGNREAASPAVIPRHAAPLRSVRRPTHADRYSDIAPKTADVPAVTLTTRLRSLWGNDGSPHHHLTRAAAGTRRPGNRSCHKVPTFALGIQHTLRALGRSAAGATGNVFDGA